MEEIVLQTYLKGLLNLLYHLACDGQVAPDGKNCTICGDNDHQAPECCHNAFNQNYRKESP